MATGRSAGTESSPAVESRDRAVTLHRLSWRSNGDSLDVALVVHRLLDHGARVWWLEQGAGVEAGDYAIELDPRRATAVARSGLRLDGVLSSLPEGARELTPPRVALFTGSATGYPYWGYYALCLLRLGLRYSPVDGAAMAAGALERENLFVIPGGFATWGFDNAEQAAGADCQVRDFLARDGGAIGSCGGAYYLSAGRPNWTATAWAKPLYTHEYLQSGVGIVSVDLTPGLLSRGLPPTIDIPYYHGPIWEDVGPGAAIAGRFCALVAPGRIGIDNPLDHERFARDMAGRPAILTAENARGHAILFSPHPEMGDLLRKYTALDGYVRKYLPIRGLDVLRDTIRFFAPSESPSFRLVLNASHALLNSRVEASHSSDAPSTGGVVTALAPLAAVVTAMLDLDWPAKDEIAPLVAELIADLRRRVAALPPALTLSDRVAPILTHLVAAIDARAPASVTAPSAQRLMEAELAIAIVETLVKFGALDRLLHEVL